MIYAKTESKYLYFSNDLKEKASFLRRNISELGTTITTMGNYLDEGVMTKISRKEFFEQFIDDLKNGMFH
jgi:hypothetical protein